MAQTMPNIILLLSRSYKIKGVDEVLEVTHISTLLNCINNRGMLGRLVLIKLKNFQVDNWISVNILNSPLIKEVKSEKDNFLANTLIATRINYLIIKSELLNCSFT